MNRTTWLQPLNQIHQSTADSISQFTFLQYNVLAQALINRRTTFSYCTPKAGRWNFRKQNLLKEIQLRDATVMCLQECDYYDEYWRDQLSKLGYTSVYNSPKKREKAEENAKYGLVVACKDSCFEMVDHENVDFQEILRNPQSQEQFKEPMSIFDQIEMDLSTNCAQIICLRHVKDGYGILVANTHLSWRHEFKYTRLRQLHCLLMKLKEKQVEMCTKFGFCNVPIVFGCDLNDLPHNPAYTLLTEESRLAVNFDPENRPDALEKYWIEKYQALDYIMRVGYQRLLDESLIAGQHFEDYLTDQKAKRMKHVQSVIDSVLEQRLPLFYSAYSEYMKFFPDQENKYMKNTNELYGVITGGEYEPSYTNHVGTFSETLDYIFIERQLQRTTGNLELVPVKILALPTHAEVTINTALPNEELSSDHISLMSLISVNRITT